MFQCSSTYVLIWYLHYFGKSVTDQSFIDETRVQGNLFFLCLERWCFFYYMCISKLHYF